MLTLNHGGKCCGIKHICGLPAAPTGLATALGVRECFQGAIGEMNAGQPYDPRAFPKETGEERLKRLLDYIDAEKDKHLVEIVWYHDLYYGQEWSKVFKKFGFKPVTTFKNCNTSRKLTVWHRVTPLPKKKKKEEASL